MNKQQIIFFLTKNFRLDNNKPASRIKPAGRFLFYENFFKVGFNEKMGETVKRERI